MYTTMELVSDSSLATNLIIILIGILTTLLMILIYFLFCFECELRIVYGSIKRWNWLTRRVNGQISVSKNWKIILEQKLNKWSVNMFIDVVLNPWWLLIYYVLPFHYERYIKFSILIIHQFALSSNNANINWHWSKHFR